MQGSEKIAYALLKSNIFFDITTLMNENSTNKLIFLEEKVMSNDKSNGSLLTSILYHYRANSFKIQVGILGFRLALDVILFLAGLAYGLPIMKALSLASGTIKKVIDFQSYLHQNKLYKQAEITKFHRQLLGRDPNADLSQITSSHLQCIYTSLLSLTERCAILEELLSQMASAENSSESNTPETKRPAKRRKHSSSPSPSSTPSSSLRLPGRQKVKFSKTGVAYRTK